MKVVISLHLWLICLKCLLLFTSSFISWVLWRKILDKQNFLWSDFQVRRLVTNFKFNLKKMSFEWQTLALLTYRLQNGDYIHTDIPFIKTEKQERQPSHSLSLSASTLAHTHAHTHAKHSKCKWYKANHRYIVVCMQCWIYLTDWVKESESERVQSGREFVRVKVMECVQACERECVCVSERERERAHSSCSSFRSNTPRGSFIVADIKTESKSGVGAGFRDRRSDVSVAAGGTKIQRPFDERTTVRLKKCFPMKNIFFLRLGFGRRWWRRYFCCHIEKFSTRTATF